MRLIGFCTPEDPAPRVGVREGQRVLDFGARRMKDVLADGIESLRRRRPQATLEERAIRSPRRRRSPRLSSS